jgi:hypothetical protein
MLSTMEIQSATRDNLPELNDLWKERRLILSQSDPRVSLNQSEYDVWLVTTKERVVDPGSAVFVAKEEGDLIGYIVGHIPPMPPSKQARRYGIVEEIILDVHTQHSGLARRLYSALSSWFSRANVDHVLIRTPSCYAVEQAFWRGLGATEWEPPEQEIEAWKTAPEHIWLKL